MPARTTVTSSMAAKKNWRQCTSTLSDQVRRWQKMKKMWILLLVKAFLLLLQPFVLFGAGGAGKSALLSKCARQSLKVVRVHLILSMSCFGRAMSEAETIFLVLDASLV